MANAQPLTNFQEPGFFSQIQESPSLFLIPGAAKVVGLIGTGKPNRSVLQESLTRSDTGTNHFEALAAAVSSIDRAYSDSVFQYPVSSYSSSYTGSVDLSTLTLGDLTGKTFLIQVADGATQTVTFTVLASVADIAVQINAVLTGAEAYVNAASKLCIISGDGVVGDGGKKLKVLNGTANPYLGYVDNTLGAEINWKPSFASVDPNVRPLDTESYYVDYQTPKVLADLAPQSFFSLAQMVAAYGDPSASATLSLGGQAAFGNGCSIVTARQLDPNYVSLSAEMTLALADMEKMTVDVLVPMTPDTSLWPKYLQHVSKMSSMLERKERRAILGVDETSAILPLTGAGSWTTLMSSFVPSSGLEPKRIQVMSPGMALTTVKDAQLTVDGTYLAACLAGLMCNPAYDSATPMTRKAMATVDQILQPEHLRSEKNLMTSLGVTVVEMTGALVTVRRSVSADGSSIASQEPSIVFSFDELAQELRSALENRFVGTKITGDTKAQVEAATTTFLLRFKAEELITDFRNIHAEKNSVEPRQFDISFEAVPIFPFLWGSVNITITIS